MAFCGSKYTWCNQQGADIIYMRLDRAFANVEWLQQFQNIKIHNLVDTTSDHSPLFLAETSTICHKRKRRFHFEAIWIRKADCKDVIEEVWKDGLSRGTPNGLCEGLKQCASTLTSWSKSTFGRISKRIKEKKEALGRLIEHDDDRQNGVEINRLRKEVNELLDEEEVWW